MTNKIEARLRTLGYTQLSDTDEGLILYLAEKTTQRITSYCNIPAVPEELRAIWLDMLCGEFLLTKKQSGTLEGFDLDDAVKQIREGDTSVTYAIGEGSKTPEERLDSLISYLIDTAYGSLGAYRRLKW